MFLIALYVLLMVVAVVVLLPIYFRLVNGPAYRQKKNEVVIREPGMRLLGPPRPVATEARKDLVFALLSQAAYGRQPKKNNKKQKNDDYVNADLALQNDGWSRWTDFPDDGLSKKIATSHLRVEVWSNATDHAVAVAFGGTVATSGKDWKSNLRWFLPFHDDEYTQIVKNFGPAFIGKFLKCRQEPEWEFLNRATIFASGHSLGGGLAQQFAYSLPIDKDVPRVKKVFAFDPSPVTGYRSVEVATRDHNKYGLEIDRIYERREILAILRSFTNFIHKPSATNPTIRQIRYYLFSTINPISGHSISELACKLNEVSR
jgi:hypothetical protein